MFLCFRGGSVIFISSIGGYQPMQVNWNYSTLKMYHGTKMGVQCSK